MRYWLKEYGKWPTYPQLYINGQIIGGLDKIEEHEKKGELKEMLPESCKKKSVEERYTEYLKEKKAIVFVDGFPFENKTSEKAVK